MWVDGFNGTSQHIDRNVNFAVVAQTEIGPLRSLGRRRGIDLLSPVWNLLDLTPEGRGEWLPSLAYD